ncbi:hypothetical protein ACU61A_34095 [Pseudonocardia sichuanensis]
MPSSDWRPVQNRREAESGRASKSPSTTTCQASDHYGVVAELTLPD